MKVPMILKKNDKKYILEKIYPNFALYTNLDNGLRECFKFEELTDLQLQQKCDKM